MTTLITRTPRTSSETRHTQVFRVQLHGGRLSQQAICELLEMHGASDVSVGSVDGATEAEFVLPGDREAAGARASMILGSLRRRGGLHIGTRTTWTHRK